MTKETSTYLQRRRERALSLELTQLVVLGYGFGFILLLMGLAKYFLSIGAWDAFWLFLSVFGCALILITLIRPDLISPLNRLLRFLGPKLGSLIMVTLLSILYYLIVTPVGFLLRSTSTNPIARWDKMTPEKISLWKDKVIPKDLKEIDKSLKLSSTHQLGIFGVLTFFAENGKFLFIPILIVLLALGIFLFFMQTSVVAPFIYTIF